LRGHNVRRTGIRSCWLRAGLSKFFNGFQRPARWPLSKYVMLKLVLIYSASTGLQRAIVFLASIVLARSYSLAEVGQYILTQTIAQLVIPLVTLNATVALARESGQNPASAARLLRRIVGAAGTIFLASAAVVYMFPVLRWPATGVALGATEAMFAASTAFLQGSERASLILKFSSAKSALFGALLLLCFFKALSIDAFLAALSICNVLLAAVLARLVIGTVERAGRPDQSPISVNSMMRYAVATLPHTIALWVSVSSDRLILGAMFGKDAVGRYSLSYTVAQAVMLVVSGVITALPPRIANNPEYWRIPSNVVNFLKKTALVCFSAVVVLLVFMYANNSFLGIVPATGGTSYFLIAIIGAAFFFSIYYVLFSSYLYLHRNTSAVMKAGLLVGPLNVATFVALIHFFGSVGAALGLVCAYLSFGVAYGSVALRLEPLLKPVVGKIVVITLVFLCAATLFAYLMWTLDA
jgi:O-antigen/teichoic acid export membrane protein